LIAHLQQYCAQHVDPSHLEKTLYVDTEIFANEFHHDQLSDLQSLAPFGVGNEEPLFLLQSLCLQKIQKV
jgi:single-stranded DNA-specific DHH superfamily exonuclease